MNEVIFGVYVKLFRYDILWFVMILASTECFIRFSCLYWPLSLCHINNSLCSNFVFFNTRMISA